MNFILPFQEDSSLLVASKMGDILRTFQHQTKLIRIIEDDRQNTISERQLKQSTGEQDVETINASELFSHADIMRADAVIVSRVVHQMREKLSESSFKDKRDRPCFISFQPGLEFTPRRGFANRKDFDASFLNKDQHVTQFREIHRSSHWRHVSFGHPYALTPTARRQSASGNVYFFAQAISPASLRSRSFIVRVLAAIARANPDRTVYLKLRHLPEENRNHVHLEKHDYPGIVAQLEEEIPPNLKLSDCSMRAALEDAAYCITCTSTAAIDAISAGVPVAVFLDYVDFTTDRYRELMNAEFDGSGIITSLAELLELRVAYPNPQWMIPRFRGPELVDEITAAVKAFKTRSPVEFQMVQDLEDAE